MKPVNLAGSQQHSGVPTRRRSVLKVRQERETITKGQLSVSYGRRLSVVVDGRDTNGAPEYSFHPTSRIF